MTPYYKTMLEKGEAYEDFIMDQAPEKLGIALSNYKSKKYQCKKGENRQGYEIKFDDVYKKTGNLYIEIKEKSNSKNKNWIDSGIYRNDNSWLYLIGDYKQAFIFGINMLRLYYEGGHFKEKEKEKSTSKGFLLKKEDHFLLLKTLKF